MRRFWFSAVLLLLTSLLLVASPAAAQYVGASKCKVCHLPQYKSWEQTKMSQVFELLKPGVRAEQKRAKNLDPNKDYTTDALCVSCHTTGNGEASGFVSVANTPHLAGVQCEACHGPGGGYLKPNLMSLQNKEYKKADLIAAGMTTPSVATCQKCHNSKSPFYKPFDFEQRVKEGIHVREPLKYKHD